MKRWACSLLLIGIILCLGGCSSVKDDAKEKDLSDVFDFSFNMTMEDVIAYESEKYGNSEYEIEELSDKTRLDFEKYSYNDWKHKYFFDKETGLLISVGYRGIIITLGNKAEAACEHVIPLKRALLNEIGEWDEKPTGGDTRSIAYGKIDGVPCTIMYFDGAAQEIFIKNSNYLD